MHMSDALLSPQVGAAMWAAAAGCVAWAVRASRREESSEPPDLMEAGGQPEPLRAAQALEARNVPLMGVMGAFVFAAQMINFTIPGTGSSGHIGGALLLCAMLGAPAALLTTAVILTIQALLFADGGLLALGANIINMGAVTCLVAYPLLFKPALRKGVTRKRVVGASLLAGVSGLQLGALGVVLETRLSGKTALPFGPFALMIQPIHLAIGVCEGLITAGLLLFLLKAAPETVTGLRARTKRPAIAKRELALLAAAALAVGGALSWFASTRPDGLEWSVERTAGVEPEAGGGVHRALGELQAGTALLPDYGFRAPEGGEERAGESAPAWPAVSTGTSAAGVAGAGITLAMVVLIGAAMYLPKRIRKKA